MIFLGGIEGLKGLQGYGGLASRLLLKGIKCHQSCLMLSLVRVIDSQGVGETFVDKLTF